jgi:hypothetical protein
MEEKGEGMAGDTPVKERRLVPNMPNSANEKADLDNSGDLSSYEIARSNAITKAMRKNA